MREIGSQEFEGEVINSKSDGVVTFTAPWCGFCKGTETVLKTVAEELSDVKFYVMNIEENPDLAKKYNVRGVPTTLFVSHGEVKARKTGALTKAEIYKLINKTPVQKAQI